MFRLIPHLFAAMVMVNVANCFAPSNLSSLHVSRSIIPHHDQSRIRNHVMISSQSLLTLYMASDADDTTMSDGNLITSSTPPPLKTSSSARLEEKMKSWEATEEEIKAATLGGIIPGTRIGAGVDSNSAGAGRADAFDVGLYIAFPIMILSCLAFIFFPLLVGNIDITSVGPPPTS